MMSQALPAKGRKIFSAAGGVLMLGVGYYSIDSLVNGSQVETLVEKRLEIPPVVGRDKGLSIRVATPPEHGHNWIRVSSGFLGVTTASDRSLWETIRPGCRYVLSVHRYNPRGSVTYILKDAKLVSCESPAGRAA